MKNLIGAVAPTNRFLGSFKILMLIVLVTIGFVSCKDQSKLDVNRETVLIAKSDFQDSESNFDTGGKNSNGGLEKSSDTGGKGTSSDTGQIYSFYNLEDLDTGGRGNELGTGGISDTGGSKGKGTSTDGEYFVSDIGGKKNPSFGKYTSNDTGGSNGGKSTTGDYSNFDTGGNKGTSTSGGDYFFVQYSALSPDLNARESKFFCEQ